LQNDTVLENLYLGGLLFGKFWEFEEVEKIERGLLEGN
jgi:hypothetical protein